MYRAEVASILSFEELVTIEKNKKEAPTVDGLIFMDCAPNPKKQNKRSLFACYVTGVAYGMEDKERKDPIALSIGLVQWVKGLPQTLIVRVKREDIESGKRFKFWDLPPTTRLMKENPFPEPEQEEEKKS